MPVRITSQCGWVAKIEGMLPSTIGLSLRRKTDYQYVETVAAKLVFNDADAFNFSNSTIHDDLICRAVSALEVKAGPGFVKHLLGELTFKKTYGAFSEMAAYDWMEQSGIDYTPQVARTATEAVNPNGSTVDGRLRAATQDIFFDIKGFGFLEHKLTILKNRLEQSDPGFEVVIQGLMSASIDDIQSLLERPGHDALKDELARTGSATRGTLIFIRRAKQKVSVSFFEVNPVKLALENREYALRFGSQFQRSAPFMLFFVVHPWFSQGNLHQNFDGHTDTFCFEFAHQTFCSFNSDASLREGMQTNDLAKLLSAVAFLNVWPEPPSKGRGPQSRIYLNPHATHKVEEAEFATLKARLGEELAVIQI